MTVTLRVFGLEILHIEASTEDDTTEPEYDHDVRVHHARGRADRGAGVHVAGC